MITKIIFFERNMITKITNIGFTICSQVPKFVELSSDFLASFSEIKEAIFNKVDDE
jgi:hypothetical protein